MTAPWRSAHPQPRPTCAQPPLVRALGLFLAAALLCAGGLASGIGASAAHAQLGDGAPGNVAELLPVTGSLLFGAHLDPHQSTLRAKASTPLNNTSIINDFETLVGRNLDVHRIFLRWDSAVPHSLNQTLARQRTPIVSFAAQRTNGSLISYASIINGSRDADIKRQAQAIAALKVPVFLSFQHEPDASAGLGSPAQYVQAWKHYVNMYRAHGVRNVAWTWIMVPSSFLPQPVGAGGQAYYPGNDYVDYLALDGYNWYGCQPDKPQQWRSMETIAGNFRSFGLSKGKPLMLAEFGSVEDPARPGRKAAWLRETMKTLASWPEFKVASYFHTHGNCAWWADSSPSSLQAFREITHSAQTHGRANATLQLSTQQGPAPLNVTFNGAASAGAGQRTGQGTTQWKLDFGDGTSASGTGLPPSALRHTYSSGTFRSILTLTDSGGRTARDVRWITAAAPPGINGGSTAQLNPTSIELSSWVNPQGLPTTVRYQWGTKEGVYEKRSSAAALPAANHAQAHTYRLRGLSSSTRYYWRIVATNGTGTSVSKGWLFTTPGAPRVENKKVYSISKTGATVSGTTSAYGAATQARLEWAQGGTVLGSRSWGLAADAGGYYMATPITGLQPGATYRYRVVASNSYGSRASAWTSFTTGS